MVRKHTKRLSARLSPSTHCIDRNALSCPLCTHQQFLLHKWNSVVTVGMILLSLWRQWIGLVWTDLSPKRPRKAHVSNLFGMNAQHAHIAFRASLNQSPLSVSHFSVSLSHWWRQSDLPRVCLFFSLILIRRACPIRNSSYSPVFLNLNSHLTGWLTRFRLYSFLFKLIVKLIIAKFFSPLLLICTPHRINTMSSSFGGNRRFVSIAFWLQAIGIAIYLGTHSQNIHIHNDYYDCVALWLIISSNLSFPLLLAAPGGWASFSGSSGAGICPGTTAANSRLCSYGWIGFSLGFISVALLGLILYVRAHRILSILFGFFNSSSSIFLGRVFIFAGECVATPGAAFAPNVRISL